jgi:hypothetical protein
MANERKEERGLERVSLQATGQQYFPEQFRDPNFHYRWVNYDPQAPFKATQKERMGYEPVPLADTNHVASKIFTKSTVVQEGYVTCPLKSGAVAVLMRMPMKLYLEREALKEAARKAEKKAMSSEGMTVEDNATIKKTFSFTNK